jgi:DNA polymerase I-like protein with 3'-5' exonuclease and polymerase domains
MRAPHVLLTLAEVEQAVERLLEQPSFVIDVETTIGTPRTNEVRWVGLGAQGLLFLVPLRHPKGVQLIPEHKEKTPAFILFGADDPRSLTPNGKPSMRLVEHTVPAVFAPPPEQLFPDQVFAALKPLLFSDRGKIGHNVKFDLQSIAKYYGGVIPPGPYHDTIIVRHTLTENLQEYGLKWLTCEWFGVPYKQREKFYPNLGKQGVENFGLDQVARYLAKDVFYCWRMFQRFFPLLERRGLQGVYDFEMSVYPIIMEMEQRGFPVDLGMMDIARKDHGRGRVLAVRSRRQTMGDVRGGAQRSGWQADTRVWEEQAATGLAEPAPVVAHQGDRRPFDDRCRVGVLRRAGQQDGRVHGPLVGLGEAPRHLHRRTSACR